MRSAVVMIEKNKLILYILIIVTVFTFVYICIVNKKSNLDTLINRAADETEFKPMKLVVYDKNSTEDNCNRLIEVEPFNWTLLNIHNQLFVLNPERLVRCANNTMPAIKIRNNVYTDTCLHYSSDFIEKTYKSPVADNVQIVTIPFSIDKGTKIFTIFSAINMLLARKLLKYDLSSEQRTPDVDSTIVLPKHSHLRSFMRHRIRRSTPDEDSGRDAARRRDRTFRNIERRKNGPRTVTTAADKFYATLDAPVVIQR